MIEDRIEFLVEIDKLKNVIRQTMLFDASRRENSAEHSWNLAMTVMLFSDLANEKIDVNKAIKMALVHDVVEVYAGDTFVYDAAHGKEQFEKELKALARLESLLEDSPFKKELRELWIEFEEEESSEAKFVKALDRFFPLLQNWKTEGHSWVKHGITRDQVMERNSKIQRGSELLWKKALEIIESAVEKGHLKE